MLNFFHTFEPERILISLGFINIYWYGFFMVLGILAGLGVSLHLAKYYKINKELILDLAFFLIISGLIGARIYDIALEFPYYLKNPIDIFKIWQGGLAIHGAIIGGLIGAWIFFKKNKIKNYWQIISIITPGLALGQAIGRFGNYFNQELFGNPTNLAWGIPISVANRPEAYINFEYFHPTFLYESIGSFIIFLILINIHIYIIKNHYYLLNTAYCALTLAYLFLYSVLRFSLEFIRIDYAPTIFNLRAPQIVSLLIIIFIIVLYFYVKKSKKLCFHR